MKDPRNWLIIGLVVVIVFIILFQKPAEPVDLTPYKTAVALADQKINQLLKDSVKLARKIKSDSLRQAIEKKAYQSEVKKKSSEIARLKANPKVIEVLAANPETDSLVKALVSKNDLSETRIDSLENDLSELRVDMKAVAENLSGRLKQTQIKLKATEDLANQYKQDARKIRRANRVWKALVPVTAVGVLLLSQ